MISRFMKIGILLVTTGFCASIVACGGDEAPPPASSATESPAAPVVVRKAPDAIMPAIPSRRPSTVEQELAAKVEMPDFYPADAPVFAGTPPSKVFVEGDKINVMFGTNDPLEGVLEFLNGELPRLGWDNAIVQRLSNSVTVQATKPGRELTIMLTEFENMKANSTLIAVVVTAD